jgi:hypothetical protein
MKHFHYTHGRTLTCIGGNISYSGQFSVPPAKLQAALGHYWEGRIPSLGKIIAAAIASKADTEADALVAVGTANGNHNVPIAHLPSHLQTKTVCIEARKANPYALKQIPITVLDEEICLAWCESNGVALRHVPEEFKTYRVCLAAISNHPGLLDCVPVSLRTAELCLIAVKLRGDALEHVPYHKITEELALAAVTNYAWGLSLVPYPMRTEALCIDAVKHTCEQLKWVPFPLLTPELVMWARESQFRSILGHLPAELCTDEFMAQVIALRTVTT